MADSDLDQVVRYLKVLAHEARLRLLGMLATRERSVGELAEVLGLKESTVSHHLAKLSKAGLVRMRPEGTVHVYQLHLEGLRAVSRDLFTPERVASFAPLTAEAAVERKVLRTYVVDDRLTKIPDTRKRRDVILRWLVSHFEEGPHYSEREVNQVIGRVHPDFATLRRELIGARLMGRENGIYWRLPKRSLEGGPMLAAETPREVSDDQGNYT